MLIIQSRYEVCRNGQRRAVGRWVVPSAAKSAECLQRMSPPAASCAGGARRRRVIRAADDEGCGGRDEASFSERSSSEGIVAAKRSIRRNASIFCIKRKPAEKQAFLFMCRQCTRTPAGTIRRPERNRPWDLQRESSCTTSRSRACPQWEAMRVRSGD